MHHATHRRGRVTGHALGHTREEADRAAVFDSYDTPALEAPMRPGTAWIVGGIVACLTLFAGGFLLIG